MTPHKIVSLTCIVMFPFVTTWVSCEGRGGTFWLRRVRVRTKLDCSSLEFFSATRWQFQFVALGPDFNLDMYLLLEHLAR